MDIAIIPARGGSKRIIGKNIKPFLGQPIIGYSIKAALESKCFDKVYVSTDDHAIAKVSIEYGAEVPFYRDGSSSDDHATLHEVVVNFLSTLESAHEVEKVGLILATAPLLTIETVRNVMSSLDEPCIDSALTVTEFEVSPFRSLSISASGCIIKNHESKLRNRSQDFPSHYYDAGQIYGFYAEGVLKREAITSDRCKAVILDRFSCQDIDTMSDWYLAEAKYKLIKDLR